MNTIRMFVAVELSAEVKQEMGRVAGVLANRVSERSVRWVNPDLMHLTLRFLGQTATSINSGQTVSQLDAVIQAMDVAAQNQPSLTLRLAGTGCFPNTYRPRVIWAGLAGQVAELAAFKQELDVGLQPLGWEREKRPFRQAQDKPFKPHLTLGRVKYAGKLRGVSWEVDVEEMMVGITAVSLIESDLTRQGPIYTTRHVSQFAST